MEVEFLQEKNFRREEYDTYIRRIHYDDRDAVMYEKMLYFLFAYVTDPDSLLDRAGVLEEYMHWNAQRMDKCFYHMPHDLPYLNICRAYQSVAALFAGDFAEGLSQLRAIGKDNFAYDGRAPKIIMTQDGHRYEPVSKLFLLYNYAKAFRAFGLFKEEQQLREDFLHAFTVYGDEEHREHDAFYKEQMERFSDRIFYPVFERVYPLKGGMTDFFVYFDEEKSIPVSDILYEK